MTTSTKTFYVAEANIAEVQKLAKRAVEQMGAEFKMEVDQYNLFLMGGRVFPSFMQAEQAMSNPARPSRITIVRAVNVTLPDLQGYKLLAKIDRIATDRNLVTRIDGDATYKAEEFATAELTCAHCGKRRSRKSTLLVLREADGALLQIGTACAGEYFGSPALAKMVERLSEFVLKFSAVASSDDDAMDEEKRGGNQWYLSVLRLAEICAAVIRVRGFTSTAKADCFRRSTKEVICAGLIYPKDYPLPEVTEADQLLAKQTIHHGQTLEPVSDFDSNVRSICSAEYIELKFLGFLAAAVNSYKMMSEARESTSHLGEVNDKILANVEVVGIYRHYVNMMDDQGHKLSWRANFKSMEKLGITTGWKGRIRTTVKGHSEFRGVKQTEIGLVKTV